MKRVLALIAALFPAVASADMTPALCQGMYDRAVTVLDNIGDLVPELRFDQGTSMPGQSQRMQVSQRDADTCAVKPKVRQLNQPFGEIRWRAEGAEAYVSGQYLPTALRIEVRDLKVPDWNAAVPLDLTIGLRRTPGEPTLMIEALYLLTKAGEGLQLSGKITGAHFDTLQSAQLGFGSLRLNEVALRFDHNPRVMKVLPVSRFDIRRDAAHYMRGLRDGLSQTQLNSISFENLRQYIGIFPGGEGVFQMKASSPNGLGIFQILAAQNAFESQEKLFSEVVSIGLHGVAISVDWTPGAP